MSLTQEQALERLGVVMEEVLAELRHIRVDLAERAPTQSSVEIKSSARGADVTCKSYFGSDIRAAGDGALAEYIRLVGELNGGGKP